MVKNSRTEIVPTADLWSEEDIDGFTINEAFIDDIFSNQEEACIFLARCKIIKNSWTCNVCESETSMRLVKRSKNPDGFIWNCLKPCTASKSIRSGSVLKDPKLAFKIVFKILYKYLKSVPFQDIAFELNINRKTASAYGLICRDLIVEYMTTNNQMIGGVSENGVSSIVEIDESLFFKAKYNRGNHTNGQWYVGGVERGTKNTFMVPVSSRDTATMLAVIQDNVMPGTTIITDKWRAYASAIRQIPNMTHLSVNHRYNFVDPDSSITHTQTIEGFWSHAKRFLRSKNGIKQSEHNEYLIQHIWSYRIQGNKRFNALLSLFRLN